MKKILLAIGFLMTAASVPAQEMSRFMCEQVRVGIKAPYYYCDCHLESDTVHFPMEATVKDTMWFTATISDVRRGLAAYWFSEDSVTMEVYAFCSDKLPVYMTTIGGNRMQEIDADEIQQRMGNVPEELAGQLSAITPHIRIYPQGKGSGQVYCFRYNDGPASTCEAPLPMIPAMTMVCAGEKEYCYRLDPDNIPEDGETFFRWKQQYNSACDLSLTLGSCEGEEIGHTVLSDSLHVFFPDASQMLRARELRQPVWVHVSHEAGKAGRFAYYSHRVIEHAEPIEQSICQGKKLNVNGREYSNDTVFTDTVWVVSDTLRTVENRLSFTAPEMEYDTIRVDRKSLKRGYRAEEYGITFYQYGDTLIERHPKDDCARLIRLSVISPEAIENITDKSRRATKQIQNGNVFILMDDRRYTVLGQPTKK